MRELLTGNLERVGFSALFPLHGPICIVHFSSPVLPLQMTVEEHHLQIEPSGGDVFSNQLLDSRFLLYRQLILVKDGQQIAEFGEWFSHIGVHRWPSSSFIA